MDILIAFIIGAAGGALVVAYIAGASIVNRESEIYMEGFIAGQKEGDK